MSGLQAMLGAASGSAAPKVYVDEVFNTFLYTGNGSSQAIVNGIDLATKGGLVWIKNRSASPSDHILRDSTRSGASDTYLSTNSTAAQANFADSISYASNGFSVLSGSIWQNAASNDYIAWAFCKATKFFDVVTFTSSNDANQRIPHNLGIAPGFILVKDLDNVGNWEGYHRTQGRNTRCIINSSSSFATLTNSWGTSDPTASDFGWNGPAYGVGRNFVAYVFAHDTSADGIIQCGSFTGGASTAVNLGWEPQYLLVKVAGTTGSWAVFDPARGVPVDFANVARIFPNTSDAESLVTDYIPEFTSTGFTFKATGYTGHTFIYIAIRRSNKPPTSGTQVYAGITYTGDGTDTRSVSGAGFAPDLAMLYRRTGSVNPGVYDRLRGKGKFLDLASTNAEASRGNSGNFKQDGLTIDWSTDNFNTSGTSFIAYMLKRAAKFFDEVCYTGDGSNQTIYHNLGVPPELVIVRPRNAGSPDWLPNGWWVASTKTLVSMSLPEFADLRLNTTAAAQEGNGGTISTASPGAASYKTYINGVGTNFVAYLFATLAGISKVGSYTGNGGSQTINCGFAGGARFILIKRTDAAGDWFIWDTARGVVAGNDPHLSVNTTAAEVTTDDSIDPDASGFIVNQVAATNININAAKYLYLAIA